MLYHISRTYRYIKIDKKNVIKTNKMETVRYTRYPN